MSIGKVIPQDKRDAIMNLYTSNIDVEFISMQVDLDIPTVITVLRELGVYQENKKSTWRIQYQFSIDRSEADRSEAGVLWIIFDMIFVSNKEK